MSAPSTSLADPPPEAEAAPARVHAPPVGIAGVLLALAAAGGAEMLLAAQIFDLGPLVGFDAAPAAPSLALAVAGHLAICAALWGWVGRRRRRALDVRIAGLLALKTSVLGPVGPPVTLATLGLYVLFRRVHTTFADWYLALFARTRAGESETLFEQLNSGREQANPKRIESFTDIMSFGTPAQKQAVVALVSRNFKPGFTPALKRALTDTDPSVRVQAATAMVRLEHQFHVRRVALEQAATTHPRRLAAHLALAHHLDGYAFAGLLDPVREQEIRDQALICFRRCLELSGSGEQSGIRCDLGRLLLRLGREAEAVEVLEPLIHQTRDGRVMSWYAESLYQLGRHEALRNLFAELVARLGAGALPEALQAMAPLWLEAEAETDAAGAAP
jgi:hypothetical protein